MTTARRTLIKGAAALGALSAASSSVIAQPFLFSPSTELLPKGKKRRVVVLGGGWGGLATARHLREDAPDLEVVLLEQQNPIRVKFDYKMGEEGHLLQTITDDNFRRKELWQAELQWYGTMVKDFTGG